MVAPGVNCWGNVWPNMSVATVNISNYVRDGAALGTMGMMNTVWVDDGENLGAYNWHGLLWGAECSWSPARPLKGEAAKEDLAARSRAFDRSFDALFFGTPDVAATLYRFDSLRAMPVRGIVTDGAVWTSMLEIYPGEVDAAAVTLNERVVREATALRSVARGAPCEGPPPQGCARCGGVRREQGGVHGEEEHRACRSGEDDAVTGGDQRSSVRRSSCGDSLRSCMA